MNNHCCIINILFEHNYIMFIVFLRVLIIYITVLVFLRLMGKRQIGEMQPYEVVITLIIADLATLPMSDTNIPLLNGILPLAILVLIHFTITLCTRKSIKIRRLMSGRPVIVISPNGIEYEALKDLNMNIDDLIEMIRQCNYYSFDQVEFAIIETNGKMSVIPKSASAPATAQDVGINNPPVSLPKIIVSDGKIMKQAMKTLNIDNKKFNKIISYINADNIKQIVVLSLDDRGKAYYQLKGKSASVIQNINKEINL